MARGRKAAVVEAGPVEGPWNLADGWRWEPLGAVVTQSSGKLQPDPTSELPFVGLDSVEPNSTTLAATVPFSTMRSAANSFSRGEVLYGRLRPYLNKVWLADRAGACSGEFIVLQPRADLEAEYLKWLLHHGGFVRFASHAVTGDRPRIDLAKMSGYPVPLPPLDTQRRIVARIDELFTELDDGEAALACARADLETYRKSLLKAAVTGELTADWRTANPPAATGEQLLQRILADRKARWEADPKNKGKRYKEPEAADTSELAELPEGWAWAAFGQVFDRVEAGLNVKALANPPAAGETGIVKLSAVTWWDFDEEASKTLLPSTPYDPEALIQAGDFLISRANTLELVGAPAIVRKLTRRLVLSDKVLRLVMPERLKSWCFFVLRSPFGRAWIERFATGNQLSMRNISQESLRRLPIPMPPLVELEQILARISEALESGSETGAIVEDLGQEASQLRQSILAAAFHGELVQ